MGNCPKCQKTLSQVVAEDIKIRVPEVGDWKGISYKCPHCSTISVWIDPVILRDDTLKAWIS